MLTVLTFNQTSIFSERVGLVIKNKFLFPTMLYVSVTFPIKLTWQNKLVVCLSNCLKQAHSTAGIPNNV